MKILSFLVCGSLLFSLNVKGQEAAKPEAAKSESDAGIEVFEIGSNQLDKLPKGKEAGWHRW